LISTNLFLYIPLLKNELQQYYPGRFAATRLCGAMVNAGMSGRKNGVSAGFYTYSEEKDLVPVRWEVDEFLNDNRDLRADLDRLESRLARLNKRINTLDANSAAGKDDNA